MTNIHLRLHEHLAVKKLCARWIPHNLTITQKKTRVDWCEKMSKNTIAVHQMQCITSTQMTILNLFIWAEKYTAIDCIGARSNGQESAFAPSSGISCLSTILLDLVYLNVFILPPWKNLQAPMVDGKGLPKWTKSNKNCPR